MEYICSHRNYISEMSAALVVLMQARFYTFVSYENALIDVT